MWELTKIVLSGLAALSIEIAVVQLYPDLSTFWLVLVGTGVWAAIWLLLSLVTREGM